MKKSPMFDLPKTHFSADSEYQKIRFRVPVSPLLSTYYQNSELTSITTGIAIFYTEISDEKS